MHDVGARLRRRRPDEQLLGAERRREPGEADVDGAVEVPDRREALRRWDDVVVGHERPRAADRDLGIGIVERDAFGALEEEEVAQGVLAERHERDLHAGGEVLRRRREIRPAQVRRRADRSEEVLDEREVQHLLLRDGQDRRAPAVHGRELLGGEPLVDPLLHREGGEEVLAEDGVLELGGLAQEVDELLAILDDDRWLGLGRDLADRAAHATGLGQPPSERRYEFS